MCDRKFPVTDDHPGRPHQPASRNREPAASAAHQQQSPPGSRTPRPSRSRRTSFGAGGWPTAPVWQPQFPLLVPWPLSYLHVLCMSPTPSCPVSGGLSKPSRQGPCSLASVSAVALWLSEDLWSSAARTARMHSRVLCTHSLAHAGAQRLRVREGRGPKLATRREFGLKKKTERHSPQHQASWKAAKI